MSWCIEASGATGANLITIEPIKMEGSDSGEHVRIRVTPTRGEHPTMPILPRGMVYQDRAGLQYTILNSVMEEKGPDDGEASFWIYNYLALIGAHTLTGLQA